MHKSFIIQNHKDDNDNKLMENSENNNLHRSAENFEFLYSDFDIPNYQDGVGYRSPCVSLQPFQGSTSPAGQGRSVREFEEQMATLRKENFNLKLRLYFIEESIPGYQQASNSSEGQETLMKQLIDARVEMEILRKEIQDKQDLLKEAAQAMTQMEKIQKDTEFKYQEMVDELKQKIRYLEMDRDMEKSKGNSELMQDLMGRSEISENMNALQRIRELEDLLKQSDDKLEDFQQQISKLDEILSKRDETIREYEEKVKELVFQNSELLESVENRDMEVATKERSIKGLRSANTELKSENEKLKTALKSTQDNFLKEMSGFKQYESQMRQQQDALSRMQSTITIKTANTARLLERIQDYEKMVIKINMERNIVKRENQFFRVIMNKLNVNNNQCHTWGKQDVYQNNFIPTLNLLTLNQQKTFDFNLDTLKKSKEAYKFKHKLSVQICNGDGGQKPLSLAPNAYVDFMSTHKDLSKQSSQVAGCEEDSIYQEKCREDLFKCESGIPIRYTISDSNLFSNCNSQKSNNKISNSCLMYCNDVNCRRKSLGINTDLMLKKNNNNQDGPIWNNYNAVGESIRYVYSKFGPYP